jgi:hypothetical protein
MKAMNEKRTVKQEIESLYAETLALQTILVKVLGRLRAVDPALAAAIAAGLDDAADHVEHIAIRLGEAASPALATARSAISSIRSSSRSIV